MASRRCWPGDRERPLVGVAEELERQTSGCCFAGAEGAGQVAVGAARADCDLFQRGPALGGVAVDALDQLFEAPGRHGHGFIVAGAVPLPGPGRAGLPGPPGHSPDDQPRSSGGGHGAGASRDVVVLGRRRKAGGRRSCAAVGAAGAGAGGEEPPAGWRGLGERADRRRAGLHGGHGADLAARSPAAASALPRPVPQWPARGVRAGRPAGDRGRGDLGAARGRTAWTMT